MVFVDKLRRSTSIAAAALLLVATAVPLLSVQTASAYQLLGQREIRMQSAVVDQAGLDYRVDFELSGATNIGGIVVTFCEGTPIIGDPTCETPGGFSIASNAFTGGNGTGGEEGDVDMTGFTAAVSNVTSDVGTADNTFTLTNAAPVSGAGSDSVVFTLNNVTNPSLVNQSFYARIMVYETDAEATAYTTDNDPELTQTPAQAGGIALSTAEVITIEAKVQERITFCVFATDAVLAHDDTDCSSLTDPVILGDDNGVLSSVNPSISKDAKFNITTNASAGATIRMRGDTLTTGGFSIDTIGNTAAAHSANTEQFGLCVYSDGGAAEPAGLNPIAPYDSGACAGTTQGQGPTNDNSALFAFHDDVISSTYGSSLAQKDAGDWSTGVLVFLGGVSNVTEPGIYDTTLDFVATGRY